MTHAAFVWSCRSCRLTKNTTLEACVGMFECLTCSPSSFYIHLLPTVMQAKEMQVKGGNVRTPCKCTGQALVCRAPTDMCCRPRVSYRGRNLSMFYKTHNAGHQHQSNFVNNAWQHTSKRKKPQLYFTPAKTLGHTRAILPMWCAGGVEVKRVLGQYSARAHGLLDVDLCPS